MPYEYRQDLPDAAAYHQLYQSTGWDADGYWSKELLAKALANSWHVESVYAGDTLVGSGRIVSDGFMQCLICEMVILPDYRGQGLGKAIMQRLLDHCKAQNIRWVQLSCAKGKQGFYQQFGFQARDADAPGMFLFL